ncbi:MAG: questin oxidase family protein [Burkholderiaceae bacterium]|nr:questin oxidase family protein [Burkholderiaceae bacterium]
MTDTHSTLPTLNHLLDRTQAFGLAARGTTNHLPMALIALQRMGASATRLQAYFDQWAQHKALPHVDAAPAVQARQWSAWRGQARAFESLSRGFAERVAQEGAPAVVAEVWAELGNGVATNAFHALIRVAYGLEAGHAGEIGAGLASLVVAHLPLDLSTEDAPYVPSVPAALERIHLSLGGAHAVTGAITSALRTAAADPRLAQSLSLPEIQGQARMAAMADAALQLYAQTRNFTVLHLVTMLHAGRLLLQHCPQLQTPQQDLALWLAFCTAYAAVGAPQLQAPALSGAPLSWPEIFALAVAQDDDHVIKLSLSCHEEFLHYGRPLYQQVASDLVRGAQR